MNQPRGKVYLVGAGPGDPGLITVKGLRVLVEAEVVVYDRLVGQRLLAHAPSSAELVDVGKGRGQRRMSQDEINALLVARGRRGQRVVRLKGGDPFLFGRGGEEAEALAAAGVPFEVVPGVTSAIAVPAYAGIPVTHRAVSSSLSIVTGSEDPEKEASRVDWAALARADTLVVLMGLEGLPSIVGALQDAGRGPETPVALVQWGTEPRQQTVVGNLGDILQRAQRAGLTPPVVIVVGEVVRLRDRLRWFDTKPLFGKRVLVPRTRHQAGVLSELLAGAGAWPVELPTIEIEPTSNWASVDRALSQLSSYRWVVFTSANGVELLFQRLGTLGSDARAFGTAKVCAIGPGTAEALGKHGLRPDLVPGEYVAEGIVQALRSLCSPGDRVLLPRAAEGREVLAVGLRAAGAHVDEVALYRTVLPAETRERAREVLAQGLDAIAFTSSSTVRHLVEVLEDGAQALRGVAIACIGPVTEATARELGLRVDVVAREHTVPGLVAALVEHFRSASTPPPS
ncbi:MAG: uroporphyrinogen-III C-methyltransferase [Chloroflexi bacterium]|nr:uroporphyrinogen-III C-methyltransferase [Chloroflexota bacterium]